MIRSDCCCSDAGVRAVGAVHADTAAAGDEAHDVVARHRRAALGQLGVQHAGTRPAPQRRRRSVLRWRTGMVDGCRPLGELLLGLLVAAELGDQPLHHVPRRDVALPDRGVERRHVRVAQFAGQRRHRLGDSSSAATEVRCGAPRGRSRPCPTSRPPRGAPWRTTAGSSSSPAATPRSPASPARSRRSAPCDVKTSTTVAVFELALQRHQPAVDPRADAAVPDLGVHRVGEVHRRRPRRQRDHVALRREHEDLLHRKVVAQRLQELAGVRGLPLPVEQLTHPGHVVDLGRGVRMRGVAALGFLVAPVRGDAVLGGAVHVAGADLHLQRLALRTDDRGVQRLVHPVTAVGRCSP